MTKKMSNIKYYCLYIGIAMFAVVLDQVTKIIMEPILVDHRVIPVLGDWLTFAWTLNDGGAFGGFGGKNIMFFLVTILGLPMFVLLLNRSKSRSIWGQLGFAFMIGGTIGNAIDRAFLGDSFFGGSVRDFISVEGFAIFNVADSFLVVGVIMVCLALIFFDYDAVIVPTKKSDDE